MCLATLALFRSGLLTLPPGESLRAFDYAAASAMLIIIMLTVSLFDIFSQLLRKVVFEGKAQKRIVSYLGLMSGIVVLIELAIARVIDVNAILRAL